MGQNSPHDKGSGELGPPTQSVYRVNNTFEVGSNGGKSAEWFTRKNHVYKAMKTR